MTRRRANLQLLALLLVACGGASARYPGSDGTTSGGEAYGGGGQFQSEVEGGTVARISADAAPAPEAARGGLMESLFGNDGGGDADGEAREEERDDFRTAQAVPRRRHENVPPAQPSTPPTEPNRQEPENQTATDATSGPLLIYEATLNLAVYQVQDNQRAVVQIAQELGGYLGQQNDQTVVVRVPAAKFREALGRVEALGDVLHRNIQALDVSEQFRDLQIRLRNAEQVRDRLAALLEQANNVEQSLQIERELERLTGEIESMKGRLRFLEDRISFSTITVNFAPREQENLQGEVFHLPFDWLQSLGLRTLLDLR
ncbi:MAG: DUF4349 domain-containing protein [Deltaproteobacteria bacterium]|nr:DUF4349 domain-containing protein [Deltaproteobacteria bacterium]